jgi:PIN domain nuclease of toxin-antitoxin system
MSAPVDIPIAPPHVHAVTRLPWIHRDPFDRLLIAQAVTEILTIMTADPFFADYDVPVVW